MDPPQRLTRRSHTKSKKGCVTCRRRHIRCDEGEPTCRNCLRYGSTLCYEAEQLDEPETDADLEIQSLWPEDVTRELHTWTTVQSMPDAVETLPSIPTLLCTFVPENEDTRTLYFIASLAAKLVHEHQSQMLAFGTMIMPQFLEQAAKYRFVRDAVIALSAYHLSWLSKRTGLDTQMAKYRAQASGGIARAANEFSKENADALLTASMLLAWSSPDDNDFAQYLSGIITLVQQMSPWKDESRLTTLLQHDTPLPTDDKRLMVAYLSLDEDDLVQMKPLVKKLNELVLRLEPNSEALEAAQELLSFVHNTRLVATPLRSFAQQTRVLRQIQTWIPWCPDLPKGLQSRNIQILTVMAYYHAVAVASESYLPDATRAMFLSKRCEVIGNIWSELLRLEQSEECNPDERREISEAIDMTVVPLVYAVRYRLKHVTSGEALP